MVASRVEDRSDTRRVSSSAIDAASAAGSVLGGVGGLAGLWALVDQRRERRRQRLAPPPAVLDNILIIREAARQVVASPRSKEWFEEAALVQATDELTRLRPLLERPALARCLKNMQDHWTVASGWGSLIERPGLPLPQSEAFVHLNAQKEAATGCLEAADRAIAMLRTL